MHSHTCIQFFLRPHESHFNAQALFRKQSVESPIQLPLIFCDQCFSKFVANRTWKVQYNSRSFCVFSAVSLSLLWVLLETVHLALAQIFKSQDSMHMQWLDAKCIFTYMNNMTCIYTCTYVIFPFCVWCTCLAKIASRKSGNDCRVDSVACKERHLSKVEPGRQLAAGAAFRI